MSVNEKMTAIADNIRSKTGGTEALTLDEMADGVNEVYDKGRADGWTEFQNPFTVDGTRGNYYRAFAYADFTGKTFNPTIFPKRIGDMFYCYAGKELPRGIDFSKTEYNETTTTHGYLPVQIVAYSPNLETFPDMGIKACRDITSMFRDCPKLRSIEKLRVLEITTYTNTFNACTALEYIKFEGSIGRNISFSSSPLDIDSLKDIISHLENYTGTENEGKYTLTLKDECKTNLRGDTETVELDGEVYTYFELIAAKGWNLA